MANDPIRLTPRQVADEIKRQLTSGHNAGRSITQALAFEALDTIERLSSQAPLLAALEESVKLQSHYAMLLNSYDGGERMQFDSSEAWLARLAALATPSEEGNQTK